ncbi:hypothetical protein [Amycolatopsis sp. cmx-11-12]|uniref:hypothetical protein n=1 Tax=Amycolatopsis sp. cmx-11-12 TaxID=2785795 RepID=UPI003916DEBA
MNTPGTTIFPYPIPFSIHGDGEPTTPTSPRSRPPAPSTRSESDRADVSGKATTVLQAGTIEGGVHIHPGSPSPAPVSAKPIMEWDPFDLDVHHAIRLDDSPTTVGETALPKYLRRDHEVLRTWPLVYPRTADDLLRLDSVVPRTVLWLNETHNHLSGSTGEVAAAWLRTLLESSAGPVVVLGTLWPRYWAELIASPLGGRPDDHPHARGLLQHRARVAGAGRLPDGGPTSASG